MIYLTTILLQDSKSTPEEVVSSSSWSCVKAFIQSLTCKVSLHVESAMGHNAHAKGVELEALRASDPQNAEHLFTIQIETLVKRNSKTLLSSTCSIDLVKATMCEIRFVGAPSPPNIIVFGNAPKFTMSDRRVF